MIAVLHLFAGARDLAGAASVSVELPNGATVADFRRAIGDRFPALAQLLTHSRIAVNQEFADDSAVIPEGAELALIPPVSGGSA